MDNVTELERRIDRVVTSGIPISTSLGGVDLKDYGQMLELAKTMATAKHSIPAWLRGSPGDCLMIYSRAHRWGMDPYFVAEKSYLMINPRTNESKVGWESQLVHAVIESLAPLKHRLRHRYDGEGDDTVCIVWATFKGEDESHSFKSETLGKRIKDIGKSEKGNFRGSPLWLTKPRVQLFYDASRDWARINCPDVLAGVYARDELIDMEAVEIAPPSKVETLAKQLRDATAANAAKDRGLNVEHVKTMAAGRSTIIEGDLNTEVANEEEPKNGKQDESGVEGRQSVSGDGGLHDDDAGGGSGAGRGPKDGGEAHARSQAAQVKGQGESLPADDARGPKGKGKR